MSIQAIHQCHNDIHKTSPSANKTMKNELLAIIGCENYENFRKWKSVYFYFDNLKTGEETKGYFKKHRSKNNTYEIPEYLVSLADDSFSVTLCDLSKVTDLFERGEYRLNSKNN